MNTPAGDNLGYGAPPHKYKRRGKAPVPYEKLPTFKTFKKRLGVEIPWWILNPPSLIKQKQLLLVNPFVQPKKVVANSSEFTYCPSCPQRKHALARYRCSFCSLFFCPDCTLFIKESDVEEAASAKKHKIRKHFEVYCKGCWAVIRGCLNKKSLKMLSDTTDDEDLPDFATCRQKLVEQRQKSRKQVPKEENAVVEGECVVERQKIDKMDYLDLLDELSYSDYSDDVPVRKNENKYLEYRKILNIEQESVSTSDLALYERLRRMNEKVASSPSAGQKQMVQLKECKLFERLNQMQDSARIDKVELCSNIFHLLTAQQVEILETLIRRTLKLADPQQELCWLKFIKSSMNECLLERIKNSHFQKSAISLYVRIKRLTVLNEKSTSPKPSKRTCKVNGEVELELEKLNSQIMTKATGLPSSLAGCYNGIPLDLELSSQEEKFWTRTITKPIVLLVGSDAGLTHNSSYMGLKEQEMFTRYTMERHLNLLGSLIVALKKLYGFSKQGFNAKKPLAGTIIIFKEMVSNTIIKYVKMYGAHVVLLSHNKIKLKTLTKCSSKSSLMKYIHQLSEFEFSFPNSLLTKKFIKNRNCVVLNGLLITLLGFSEANIYGKMCLLKQSNDDADCLPSPDLGKFMNINKYHCVLVATDNPCIAKRARRAINYAMDCMLSLVYLKDLRKLFGDKNGELFMNLKSGSSEISLQLSSTENSIAKQSPKVPNLAFGSLISAHNSIASSVTAEEFDNANINNPIGRKILTSITNLTSFKSARKQHAIRVWISKSIGTDCVSYKIHSFKYPLYTYLTVEKFFAELLIKDKKCELCGNLNGKHTYQCALNNHLLTLALDTETQLRSTNRMYIKIECVKCQKKWKINARPFFSLPFPIFMHIFTKNKFMMECGHEFFDDASMLVVMGSTVIRIRAMQIIPLTLSKSKFMLNEVGTKDESSSSELLLTEEMKRGSSILVKKISQLSEHNESLFTYTIITFSTVLSKACDSSYSLFTEYGGYVEPQKTIDEQLELYPIVIGSTNDNMTSNYIKFDDIVEHTCFKYKIGKNFQLSDYMAEDFKTQAPSAQTPQDTAEGIEKVLLPFEVQDLNKNNIPFASLMGPHMDEARAKILLSLVAPDLFPQCQLKHKDVIHVLENRFHVTVYFPVQFSVLQQIYLEKNVVGFEGVEEAVRSMMHSLNSLETYKPSSGKSGAKFYVTRDNSFVVKSVTKTELKRLKMIAPLYFQYMFYVMTFDTPSILIPILQFVKIQTLDKDSARYLLVMPNIHQADVSATSFDVKGVQKDMKIHFASVVKGTTADVSQPTIDDTTLLKNGCIFLEEYTYRYMFISLLNDIYFLTTIKSIDYSVMGDIQTNSHVINCFIGDYLRGFGMIERIERGVKLLIALGTKDTTVRGPLTYGARLFENTMYKYFVRIPSNARHINS